MLYTGIVFCFLGIALLMFMIVRAKKITKLPETERQAAFQKLVALNLGGLFCGIIGLALIVFAYFFS